MHVLICAERLLGKTPLCCFCWKGDILAGWQISGYVPAHKLNLRPIPLLSFPFSQHNRRWFTISDEVEVMLIIYLNMNFSCSSYPWSITHARPLIDYWPPDESIKLAEMTWEMEIRCRQIEEMSLTCFGATASIFFSTFDPRRLWGDTAHQAPHCYHFTINMIFIYLGCNAFLCHIPKDKEREPLQVW